MVKLWQRDDRNWFEKTSILCSKIFLTLRVIVASVVITDDAISDVQKSSIELITVEMCL